MTCIVWFIVSIALLAFEMLSPSFFFFFCLSVGSVFAAIMSWFNVLIQIEFAVFVTVSVISVYFIRPVLKRVLSRSETVNSNVDALIGENAVVVENISPLKSGFVKVLSEIWRAESDVEFKVGETAKIKSISGTRLIVKK